MPFKVSERQFQTTKAVTDLIPPPDLSPPQDVHLRVYRSVHGPIQARATVKGQPVAIAEARSTYFHELESSLAFKRLNFNEVDSVGSFQRTMRDINFAFNWFYADDRDIGWTLSGWYPKRAKGSHPDFPAWGTGEWDWQGFDTLRLQLEAHLRPRSFRTRATRRRATSSTGTTSRRRAGAPPTTTGTTARCSA